VVVDARYFRLAISNKPKQQHEMEKGTWNDMNKNLTSPEYRAAYIRTFNVGAHTVRMNCATRDS